MPEAYHIYTLCFDDPEGLGLELSIDDSGDQPLVADDPDVPPEHGLCGFDGVGALSLDPPASEKLLEGVLRFSTRDHSAYSAQGASRTSNYSYDWVGDLGLRGPGVLGAHLSERLTPIRNPRSARA